MTPMKITQILVSLFILGVFGGAFGGFLYWKWQNWHKNDPR